MPQPALDDLMALNDQLVALVEAGVPLATGFAVRPAALASELQEVNAAVARRVSQGTPLAKAIEEEPAIAPPLYRQMLGVGLRENEWTAALPWSQRLAAERAESWQATSFSLLYPAILVLLAYLGLVGFCLTLVPVLENLSRDAGIRPKAALELLGTLRRTLPYWIAIPPVGLALLAAWSRGSSHRAAAGQLTSTSSASIRESQAAGIAHALAALLESGTPLAEALSFMVPQSRPEAAASSQPLHPSALDAASASLKFPPLLHWALFESEPAIPRPTALRIAAGLYRDSAERRVARWRMLAPMFLCASVGGTVTLLYGLALFVPIIDMLKGLAQVGQ